MRRLTWGLRPLGARAKKVGEVLEPRLAMRQKKAVQKKGIGKAGKEIKKRTCCPEM